MFARRDTHNDVLPGVDDVKRNAIENDGDRECCAKEAMVSYHDDLRRLLRVRDSRQSADTAVTGASAFESIYILPTSSRPTNAAPIPPQQQAQQIQNLDEDDDPLPAGARGVNPGGRLPPRDIVQPGAAGIAARAPIDDNEPEPRPAMPPAPNNPFGVTPGSVRPGVVTPGTPSPTPPGAVTPALPAPNTPGMITPAPTRNNRPNDQ